MKHRSYKRLCERLCISAYQLAKLTSQSRFADLFIKLFFPGVAKRFKDCVEWHREKYSDIRPLFGCFWNLCVNGMFLGQRRIHCCPHADKKNIVGVCLLMVYVLPGLPTVYNPFFGSDFTFLQDIASTTLRNPGWYCGRQE